MNKDAEVIIFNLLKIKNNIWHLILSCLNWTSEGNKQVGG